MNADFNMKIVGNTVIITPKEGKFLDNSIYEISLIDVESNTGDKLNATFKLCTKLSPLYIDCNSVRSLIGSEVECDDAEILYHIREASKYADYLIQCERERDNDYYSTNTDCTIDEDNVPFEISQFVKYQAAYECLIKYMARLSSATGLQGTVGNVTFAEKETNRDMNKLLTSIKDEVNKWSDEVKGYRIEGRARIRSAVKSSRYIDINYDDIYRMPAYHQPNIDFNRGV